VPDQRHPSMPGRRVRFRDLLAATWGFSFPMMLRFPEDGFPEDLRGPRRIPADENQGAEEAREVVGAFFFFRALVRSFDCFGRLRGSRFQWLAEFFSDFSGLECRTASNSVSQPHPRRVRRTRSFRRYRFGTGNRATLNIVVVGREHFEPLTSS